LSGTVTLLSSALQLSKIVHFTTLTQFYPVYYCEAALKLYKALCDFTFNGIAKLTHRNPDIKQI